MLKTATNLLKDHYQFNDLFSYDFLRIYNPYDYLKKT